MQRIKLRAATRLVWCALAFAASACGGGEEEIDAGTRARARSAELGPPDAGFDGGEAPRADAGMTLDAANDAEPLDAEAIDGDVSDAGLDAPPPPDPRVALEEQIARVRADIASLEALLSGTLPPDFDTQQLFEVDLLAPQAVLGRAEELRAHIDAMSAPAIAPLTTTDDAGDPDAGLDAGTAASEGATTSGDDGPPDAGMPDAGPSEADERALLDQLRLERDRLRLRFLELPEDQRVVVLAAERERRRIAGEREAAEARAARALESAHRAEEARREALERAEASASALQRELLSERALVESARAELASSEGELAEQRSAFAASDGEALELLHRIEQWLATEGPSTEADELYELTVSELIVVRRTFASALDDLDQPSGIPDFVLSLPPADRLDAFPEDVRDLRDAARELDAQIALLRIEESSLRDERAIRLGEHLRTLNALRIRLLPAMSVTRREAVLGLGPEGIGQLMRELEQVWLVSRLWFWEMRRDLPQAPTVVARLLARETSRATLLWFVLELGLVVMLLTRRVRAVAALQGWMQRNADERNVGKLVKPWVAPLSALLVAVGALLLLALALEHLEELLHRDEVAALRLIVVAYAAYRVGLEVIGALVTMRIADRHDQNAALLETKAQRSSRWVLRFAFAIGILLMLSERILGRGYLYAVVTDLAWWGALPLIAVLVYQWQPEIEHAYQDRYPKSRLTPWLDSSRAWPLRYGAAFPAGARMMGLLGFEAVGDVALRFDQSRRAAAFLMRRRLEQREGAAPQAAVELPRDLLDAFAPEAVRADLAIDHFPGMDPILASLSAWRDDPDAPGMSVALVGERGAGKTSWAQTLFQRAKMEVQTIDTPRGLSTYADACAFLSDAVGIERQTTVDNLVEAIARLEVRRVVHLDQCQNLILRAIGGTEAVRALAQVAGRTSGQIVWVCSFARYTWLYLRRARQSENLFQRVVELGRWPEEVLAEFIRHRMRVADYEVSFADLGDEQGGARTAKDIARNEERFLRMLWDDSDGNPRVAMAYWLRCLVPDGERKMRVRYYHGPPTETLDKLEEQSRFMLAAIIIHENLSTDAAAGALGVHTRQAAALLGFLQAETLIEAGADGNWRVRTVWYRAAIAFLRRQRLLFT